LILITHFHNVWHFDILSGLIDFSFLVSLLNLDEIIIFFDTFYRDNCDVIWQRRPGLRLDNSRTEIFENFYKNEMSTYL